MNSCIYPTYITEFLCSIGCTLLKSKDRSVRREHICLLQIIWIDFDSVAISPLAEFILQHQVSATLEQDTF